jgi:hypothetical protein
MATPADFDLKEYEKLREEVTSLMGSVPQYELQLAAGIAIVTGYLVMHRTLTLRYPVLWLAPPIILLGGLIRILQIYLHVQVIGGFLDVLEKEFANKNTGGWEAYLSQYTDHWRIFNLLIMITYAAFWFSVFILLTHFCLGQFRKYSKQRDEAAGKHGPR